jgi:hypothetical protein
MPKPIVRIAQALAAIPVALVLLSPALARAADPEPEDIEFFEKKVRPVLATRCFKCHGPTKQEANLRLDSRATILKGGDSGPAIVPGKPEEGFLVDAINYGETYKMPPDGKLPPDQIAALTEWVKIGAPWPGGDVPADWKPDNVFNLAERKKHWSFQPIGQPPPPEVNDESWPKSDMDRLILAKLEAADLSPAPPADRRTLIRRLYFDLVGLPPTPDEVRQFVDDERPEAVALLVDRLLASPRFGERWGRHWLDLVRYAESRGHEFDFNIPNAWEYRDYVIRAINADVPYDQFVVEHVAGDLLQPPRLNAEEGFNESILGTGFWFLGEGVHSPVDVRLDEVERMDNMIDVFSKTFLGLTVGCARCHDHKFDAISQKDYYALFGFLESSSYRQARFEALEREKAVAQELEVVRREAREEIGKAVAEQQREVVTRLADYLLAAREAIRWGPQYEEPEKNSSDGGRPRQFTTAYRGQAERLAKERGLEAPVLARWVADVDAAKNKPEDVLYTWSLVCRAEKAETADEIAKALERERRHREEKRRAAAKALACASVIVDYGAASSTEFLPDGPTFGGGPVAAGELLLRDRAWPVEVAAFGAGRRDPFWKAVGISPGTQVDPGRQEGWQRPGKSIKTPTFTIERKSLYYLVQGAGRAYAAISSHYLQNGPLHGSFAIEWNAEGDWPRWIEHDVSAYEGQRAHVEFTAKGDDDLAILMVAQADAPPGDSLAARGSSLEAALEGAGASELRGVAEVYQRLFAAAWEGLRSGKWAPGSRGEGAPFVQVLVRHTSGDAPAIKEALDRYAAATESLRAKTNFQSRTAPAMWEGTGHNEHLLIRGNHKTEGDVVPRRFLEALAGPQPLSTGRGSGRRELARQIVDPKLNPFVARTAVNRVWQHLTGRGIVASVDNLGVLGERPTHPELLDYLASRLVSDGWSIKRLIRAIVLSSIYQMASRVEGDKPAAAAAALRAEEIDPANLLLHRMRVRRLQAEAIRDSILAVSGRLDATMYGPSVPVYLTAFMQGRGRPAASGPLDGAGRRSVYQAVRRNFLSPMMLAFDAPIPFTTMGRRNVSNVPAQALILMNDPFVVEQSQVFAKRVLERGGASPRERIAWMYERALSRPPSDEELQSAVTFLETQPVELGLSADRRDDVRLWADLCHVIFNLKEFVFVE